MFAVPPSPPEVDEMTTLGATLSSVMITAPDIPVPPVPPAAVAAAVNMLTPSASVTGNVQAPPVAIAVPIERSIFAYINNGIRISGSSQRE